MSESEHVPLVPRNEPVYLDIKGRPGVEPTHHLRDSTPEVKWHNPTSVAVVIDLFVGTPEARGPKSPPRNFFEKNGIKRYVWQPQETKSLDVALSPGIQRTVCQENECLQNKMGCLDPDHQHVIIGGLGPQLVNLGMQKRPILHPALDDIEAQRRAAEHKEFEAYKKRQEAEIAAARARAEQEVLDREVAARAKADADAASVAAKHQPQNNKK
jgi:hypothetical protein